MAQISKSEEAVGKLSDLRTHARQVFQTRLVRDAQDVKNLHLHIDKFLEYIKDDVKAKDKATLKKHVSAFEGLVHDELEYLFKLTRQDLRLYLRVMQKLSSFRSEIRPLLQDPSLKDLADSELNYANLLGQNAIDKLDTLELLFKKLKQ